MKPELEQALGRIRAAIYTVGAEDEAALSTIAEALGELDKLRAATVAYVAAYESYNGRPLDKSSMKAWGARVELASAALVTIAKREPAPAPDRSHGIVLTSDTYVPANPETGDRARIVATVAVVETLCLGCSKPFTSPDFDPRCSSCVESGTGPEPVITVTEPREIKVGSRWRHKRSGHVRDVTEFASSVVWLSTGNDWHIDEFRAGNEWVNDPTSEAKDGSGP